MSNITKNTHSKIKEPLYTVIGKIGVPRITSVVTQEGIERTKELKKDFFLIIKRFHNEIKKTCFGTNEWVGKMSHYSIKK